MLSLYIACNYFSSFLTFRHHDKGDHISLKIGETSLNKGIFYIQLIYSLLSLPGCVVKCIRLFVSLFVSLSFLITPKITLKSFLNFYIGMALSKQNL